MTEQATVDTLIAGLIWRLLCRQSETFPAQRITEMLAEVISSSVVEQWLATIQWPSVDDVVTSDDPVDRILDASTRRQFGIYFTPSHFANVMATLLAQRLISHESEDDSIPKGTIMDLSAGQGDLILPLLPLLPQCPVVLIEQSVPIAMWAAARLVDARARLGRVAIEDRVYIGDGLSTHWEVTRPVRAVIGNPPYVGEKNNKALFDAVKASHPDLAPYFMGRMDLQYLFFHRALDWLDHGGTLMYLTSAYWMQATGAQRLREDLLTRSFVSGFVRFPGQSLFEQAPGHESLLTIATKNDNTPVTHQHVFIWSWEGKVTPSSYKRDLHSELLYQPSAPIDQWTLPWRPFSTHEQRQWLERYKMHTSPLEDMVRSYQGFVSGMDKVAKKHTRILEPPVQLGDCVFLFPSWEDVPDALRTLDARWLKPVLRGSALEQNAIYLRARETPWALYVDSVIEDPVALALVEAHLEPYQPVLAQRREVANQRIPWYRLHWPRERALLSGPKLVTARRGAEVCFALDLSGAVVSSDCTWIPAPTSSPTPIEDLLRLLFVLNSPLVAQALELTGKQKGALMEFYAQPLHQWHVPLCLTSNGIRWQTAWHGHWLMLYVESLISKALANLDDTDASFGASISLDVSSNAQMPLASWSIEDLP